MKISANCERKSPCHLHNSNLVTLELVLVGVVGGSVGISGHPLEENRSGRSRCSVACKESWFPSHLIEGSARV